MARSDNWRINKSGIMAIEGAQILKALQKVAGAAGLPKNFKVRFAATGHQSGIDFADKELIIGAGRIFNEAPVPSDLFDVLVGLTLHETEHKNIETGLMWDSLPDTVPENERVLLQKFCNIGEDVVIESNIRANPNLADYDKALHDWAVTNMREAQPHKLLEVWIEYALGHKSTTVLNLPDELLEPMKELTALTGWLRGEYASRHPSQRATAYRLYWDKVKSAILSPPVPSTPQQPQNVGADGSKKDSGNGTNVPITSPEPSAPAPENEQAPNGAQQPERSKADTTPQNSSQEQDSLDRPLAPSASDGMDKDLIDAIEAAIQTESEDITKEVYSAFEEHMGHATSRQVPIVRSRETKSPLITPDQNLRKRLERIMTIRKRLQSRIMRGEQYGKIDKRHLHRIKTDERIFNLHYKFPNGFPNTRILLDMSGSMSGREAQEVLEAAGALQTLINAEVWCYDASGGAINLVRVDDGRLIHKCSSGGGTPSGLAIVGASLGMKRDGLIIHLTDGQHNSGYPPWNAHWMLKKRGINLVNLVWSFHTEHYSRDGMNYRRINGLAEFPDALYHILLEQAKLNGMKG